MKLRALSFPLFLVTLAAITASYWSGVAGVPFHPDESTQLFMSADLEMFWQAPSQLFWDPGILPGSVEEVRQRYRLLDAPLPRGLIGLARRAAGLSALPEDWDWGNTWAENEQAGSLPSPGLLLAGRMASAALFPFSVLFLFLTARRLGGDFTAWASALLFASNALVLLHTRRSMAEGVLLFATTFTLWALVKAEKRPWLIAIPAALALCAKQSLAALFPVALLAVLWQGNQPSARSVRIALHALFFTGISLALIFGLNPFLWRQPLPAIQAAIEARQDLAIAQAGDRGEQALDTPVEKLVGMLGSLYLTPPIFAEVGNYQAETQADEQKYLSNPLHSLFRSILAGSILLILSAFGFFSAAFQAARDRAENRRSLILILAAGLIQSAALLALVHLAWQRFYIPLVPFTSLWAAYGLDRLRRAVQLPHTARPFVSTQR